MNHWKNGLLFDREIQEDAKEICGIDEVGRGALAGPVVVGCVYFSPPSLDYDFLADIDDSKSITPGKRIELFEKMKKGKGIYWTIGKASNDEIDRDGIVNSANRAAERAVKKLSETPIDLKIILADAGLSPKLDVDVREIEKGDSKSLHIASASIMAKVYRDRLMVKKNEDYPGYGWGSNFGYGTEEHRNAIQNLGLTSFHRESFCRNIFAKPVDKLL